MEVTSRFITDVIIIIHFLWILFLLFGFCFVLRRSKVAYIHVSGLLFSLVLNVMGWYCPLTYLENYLDSLDRRGDPGGRSFMGRTLEKAIYPEMDEALIRKGEIVFVALNGIAYAWALRRTRGQKRKMTASGNTREERGPLRSEEEARDQKMNVEHPTSNVQRRMKDNQFQRCKPDNRTRDREVKSQRSA